MKRARKSTGTTGTLGNMELEVADKYKYLGQILNHKGNLMDHLKMVKGKNRSSLPEDTLNSRQRNILWHRNGSHMENNIHQHITNSELQWRSMENKKKEKK